MTRTPTTRTIRKTLSPPAPSAPPTPRAPGQPAAEGCPVLIADERPHAREELAVRLVELVLVAHVAAL